MKSPKISDKNLYFNTVKRNSPMMLLFFVGMFIVFDITLFMTLQASSNAIASGNFRDLNIPDPYSYCAETVGVAYGAISEVISALCAVFAGCVATKYLMNKRSAALFGSIPQSRTSQFFSSYFAGVTSYIIPLAVTALIQLGIFAMQGFGAGIRIIMPYILTGVMWFFFFYTFTAAVGMLCGMTSIQLLGTFTLLAYIPAAFLLLISYGGEFYNNIDFGRYVDIDIFNVLTPICRFGTSFDDPLAWYEIIAYIVAAVVIFIAAIFLYKLRDNSKAGSPIVFERIVPVIKYALMVIFTLFFGLAVYSINYESVAWLFIGCVIGVVVSYMLLNAILYKNARAVFVNPKGLAIFSVVFAVLLTVFSIDPFGIDANFPTIDTARSVEMSLSNGNITFAESENIETAYKIKNGNDRIDSGVDTEYTYSNGYDYESMRRQTFSTYSSFNVASKYGFVYTDGFHLNDVTKYKNEYLSLYNSEEFMTVLKHKAEKANYIAVSTVVVTADDIYEDWYFSLHEGRKELLTTYLEECGGVIIRDDKGPTVAELGVGPCMLPVYIEYTETLKMLARYNEYNYNETMMPTKDNIDKYLSKIDSITVGYGDEAVEYTARDKIREVFMNSAGFYDTAPAFMGDSSKLASFNTESKENLNDQQIEGRYENKIYLILK